jgi:hypothetical protein
MRRLYYEILSCLFVERNEYDQAEGKEICIVGRKISRK